MFVSLVKSGGWNYKTEKLDHQVRCGERYILPVNMSDMWWFWLR